MITVPVVCGPTAAGKTEIVNRLAEELSMVVISADSRQIYRYMDIGTDKPPLSIRKKIQYFMVDIVNPDEIFNAGRYGREARRFIYLNAAMGKKVVVCGGTGLYIKSIFHEFADLPERDETIRSQFYSYRTEELYKLLVDYDKKYAENINKNDRQRIVRALEVILKTGKPISAQLYFTPSNLRPIYIGIYRDSEEIYRRIEKRFDDMITKGFIDEIYRLRSMGYHKDLYSFNAMGYRELFMFINGEIDFETAKNQIVRKIKDYARKQMIWFRGIKDMIWLENKRGIYEKIKGVLSSI